MVFDFDDTLVWSEKMKRSLFKNLFPRTRLTKGILSSGDRYQILRKLVGKKDPRSEKLYDLEYLKKIQLCKKRKAVIKVLKILNFHKIPVFINSATPQKILRQAVRKTFSDGKFAGVFGGFGKKRNNLKRIRSCYQVLLFVGDSRLDQQIASQASVPFLHARHIREVPDRIALR